MVVVGRKGWGVECAESVNLFVCRERFPVIVQAFYPPVVSSSAVSVFSREIDELKCVYFLE